MLALPPLDEYAAFDRIGMRVELPFLFDDASDRETTNPAVKALQGLELSESMVPRGRSWKVNVPEPEARETIGRVLSPKSGWKSLGSAKDSIFSGGEKIVTTTSYYTNDETGGTVSVKSNSRSDASLSRVELSIMVSETQWSMHPWPKFKRWLHLTFAR